MQLSTMYAVVEEPVATITLNRPTVLNCANDQWTHDLHAILDALAGNDRVRVVVLRAAGRAFCSGIDLTALSEGTVSPSFFRNWENALRRLETIDPIVIAAVHGHCIGGGLQLALACDLRVARADARFGVTAVKEGIIPGMGMWRIARYAGWGRAKRLALTADVVDAPTALDWGLVDYVADTGAFDTRIAELTARVLDMAWTSTRLTKKLTTMALDTSCAEFTEVFCEFQQRATSSDEHRHAMAERRAARAARSERTLPATKGLPDAESEGRTERERAGHPARGVAAAVGNGAAANDTPGGGAAAGAGEQGRLARVADIDEVSGR